MTYALSSLLHGSAHQAGAFCTSSHQTVILDAVSCPSSPGKGEGDRRDQGTISGTESSLQEGPLAISCPQSDTPCNVQGCHDPVMVVVAEPHTQLGMGHRSLLWQGMAPCTVMRPCHLLARALRQGVWSQGVYSSVCGVSTTCLTPSSAPATLATLGANGAPCCQFPAAV